MIKLTTAKKYRIASVKADHAVSTDGPIMADMIDNKKAGVNNHHFNQGRFELRSMTHTTSIKITTLKALIKVC